ncbi:MAG: 23S rRNA (guanosine(2251)-2'-O)-methyltransferase RlmB [Bacteroidales bacterium]|jgi:23S rRNA (guanosine2251-2'-O)-methyltransferase|nr:23S rRNA (guanosine(2251)-2'-O)-methyltransferase RlmB [Bacteroidales bacterium]
MDNYIFGIRTVLEAIKAGKEIDKIIVSSDIKGILINELFAEIKKQKINFQYVPIEKINKITKNNHQGVIAYISPIQYYNLEEVLETLAENDIVPLFIILDQITDVRNFGAITRTCECANINAIIIPKQGSVRITEDAIKTSAGALFNMPVCQVDNLTDTVLLLKQYNYQIVAATEKTDTLIYDCDFTKPTAIIMGSEEFGISKQLLKNSDSIVKIPIFGKTESLNVSVSTAIVIYEAIRQRNVKSGNKL